MLRGLISRVFKTVPAGSGKVNNIAGASEAQLPTAVHLSGPAQSSRQRLKRDPVQAARVEPKRILDNISRILQHQHEEFQQQERLARCQSQSHSKLKEADVTPHIECLREVLGYTFKDPDLVRGAIFKSTGSRLETEFKGRIMTRDVQLHLARIGDILFQVSSLCANFGGSQKDGFTTEWSLLTRNITLNYCAEKLGLPRKLAECGHASRIQGEHIKGFGTLVEAIVGAVYLDSGQDGAVTEAVTTRILGTTFKHDDVKNFLSQNLSRIREVRPQLYWEDLIEVDLRSRRAAMGTSTVSPVDSRGEDPVLLGLRNWAMSVQDLTKKVNDKARKARERGHQIRVTRGNRGKRGALETRSSYKARVKLERSVINLRKAYQARRQELEAQYAGTASIRLREKVRKKFDLSERRLANAEALLERKLQVSDSE